MLSGAFGCDGCHVETSSEVNMSNAKGYYIIAVFMKRLPVILVVDNEPNILRLCQNLLERENYVVIATNQTKQAIDTVARQRVDLLLVDIRMPDADGFQILTMARQHRPDLPVVIMTGFGTVETAISALNRGADGLVLKPFSTANLVEAVKHALQVSADKRETARWQALRPLFDVTEQLFARTEPEYLYQLIVELVFDLLECSYTVIYQQKVPPEAQTPLGEHWTAPAQVMEINKMAERGILIGARRLIEMAADLHGETFYSSRQGTQDLRLINWMRELELSSVLGTPLETQPADRMLVAVREADRPGFTRADQELFMILARQAGAALENARLYSELRESLKNIEMSQQALIESDKQASAGRLTASIAHEINNPLQALQNCLDLASRGNLAQVERTHYLDIAKSELVRLSSTVQRMLDFYRPGVRDRKLTQINDLLDRVLALLKPQFDELNIVVHHDLDPKLPLVMVVANQIQQVLFNLLINAMEAISEEGEIWVQTRYLGRMKPPAVEVIIEDSGPGIPESQRQNMYKPVESTKEKGTGLGLAVSYGIMTAHGGKITLLDGRGRGACFQLILPEGDKQ